jgi:hypothetical protein
VTSDGAVLDQHAALTAHLVHPTTATAVFFHRFMQDSVTKDLGRARGMFHPVNLRPGVPVTRGQAWEFSRLLGGTLVDAVTCRVSPKIVAAMRDTAARTSQAERISRAEMPYPRGFAWLDDPWEAVDKFGDPFHVRALSWSLTSAWTNGAEDGITPRETRLWPCARVSVWTLLDDDVADGRMPAKHAPQIRRESGDLSLIHTTILPLDMNLAESLRPATQATSVLSVIHLLWIYMGMEITVTERAEGIPRGIRRRAERSLSHSDVRVVMLRRVTHGDAGDGEHREVDWSCTWPVAGHWRHLEEYDALRHHAVVPEAPGESQRQVCTVCGKAATWIRPYVKGPDGKPLKVSRTLLKLAR